MNRLSELLLATVIAAAVGAGAGHYAASRAVQSADYPVAVMDVAALVEKAVTDEKGNPHIDRVAEAMGEVRAAADELAARGFIVIEKQAVVAAPEFYFANDILVELPASPSDKGGEGQGQAALEEENEAPAE